MKELKYSIIAEIKKTDKSKVYLASMEDLNFPVVVKEIRHGNVQVFRALMNMDNEHLPQIYHVEENGNGITVVEEYIEGEVLSDYIAKGNLTEAQCIDYAKQLCDVLKVLHSHSPALIHRDIKPSNVIINSKGVLKLIDFDSTRIYKDESDTDTRLLGTEHYAPPEQYGFSQTDCRSDIYSVGVVFEKFNAYISEKNQKQWKRIVERCTLFSPDSRFQSVDEISVKLGYLNKKHGVILFFILAIILVIAVVIACLLSSKDELQKEDGTTTTTTTGAEPNTTTSAPTVAATAAPTEQDTTTGVNTDVDHTTDYSVIQPEWRDISTDSQIIVDYKTEIRRNRIAVKYLFKDRMREKDFILQEKDLDHPGVSYVEVRLYSIEAGWVQIIDDEYCKVEDGAVIISYEYMNNIKNGYYRIAVANIYPNGEERESGSTLYISDSDELLEPEQWIQNTSFETCGDKIEKFHYAVRNDSYNRIVALYNSDGEKVDPSLYRLVQDQKMIEISGELIKELGEGEEWVYCIVGSDGREQWVTIKY